MSRLASVFAGLLLISSLSGCCLLGHGMYSPYGGGGYYGGGGGCSPCQTGACGAMAPGYPSAYNPAVPSTAFAAPTTTNYAMFDRLPTY
jgi:hypothetical protein